MEERFVLAKGKYGFGYCIRYRTNEDKYEVIFETADYQQAKKVKYHLTKNVHIKEEINNILYFYEPIPLSYENSKLLLIKNRHNISYYNVYKPEQVDKIAYDYANDCYGRAEIFKYDVPEQLLTMEYIQACKDNEAKNKLLNHYENTELYIKKHVHRNNIVNIVIDKLMNKETKDMYQYFKDLDLIDMYLINYNI